MTRAYQKPGRPACVVDGCDKSLYCRGYCTAHYNRWLRGREVGTAALQRVPKGTGHINEYGYRVLKIEGHPLARAQGKVLEHRAVLFEAIGDGAHPCEWCGKTLHWTHERQSLRICVDHLDHNRLNKDRANLVVACLDCNTKRRPEVVAS